MLPVDLDAFGAVAGWSTLPDLEPFLASAKDTKFPGTILPARRQDGAIIWYAIAQDASTWRILRPLLMAYVGRTVTAFAGGARRPDTNDPVEALIHAAGARYMALLEAPPGEAEEARADGALRALLRGIKAKPPAAAGPRLGIAELLARLEVHLALADRAGAEAILQEIGDRWLLDAMNTRFLRIRVLAELRDWVELRQLPWFAELCRVRKPKAVAVALLRSIWEIDLAPFAADMQASRERYVAIRPLILPLLASQGEVPEASSLLRELEGGPPQQPSAPAAVVDLLDAGPRTVEELEAVHAFDALPPIVRNDALASGPVRAALKEARVRVGPAPRDWADWFTALPDETFDAALDYAREAKTAWPVAALKDPIAIAALARQLDEVPIGIAETRLTYALTAIFAWLRADEAYPRSEMTPLYAALTDRLIYCEVLGEPGRQAVLDLLEAQLEVGLGREAYRSVLSGVESLLELSAGDRQVPWTLGVADVLFEHAAPDPHARQALVERILTLAQSSIARCTELERRLYDAVAPQVGWPPLAVPETNGTPLRDWLVQHRVAVYSLTERAARAGQELLLQIAPGARIELSHDAVGSDRLKALASGVDLFVVVACSATHAATDFIRRYRGAQPLEYTVGRGRHSVVRAVEAFVFKQNRSEPSS